MKKTINYGLLMLMMLFSMASNIFADNKYGLKDNIQDGVILHCFDWTLADIQEEIPNIAKAGFTAVQTSPVHERAGKGSVWYDVYRPYDFKIGNGLGTEADLKALCAKAHEYGVKVIVDVVANHTDYGNVADRLTDQGLYHQPFDVGNWHDRHQVTFGMIGMWDLDTNNPTVQAIIKQYIQDLKACGVDGIRWDAIKHIGLPSEGDSFMQNVVDQEMYNYGEILDSTGGDDNVLFPEYQTYMSITDNGYGNGFANSFAGGSINESVGNFNQRNAKTEKLVYWGESHDTYANDGGESKNKSQNVIDRAYAVVAGNNGATALYFSRPAQKAKNDIKFGKGSVWYDVYRPYDFKIGNGLGTEADLKALCAKAHEYGVKVIVDVVANHTDYGNVADRLTDQGLYHQPFDVGNWHDRHQVTFGMIGMWDLDTNNPTVQAIIKQYIQDLKACGVDGIRWDAIKHIGLPSEGDSFMQNVVDQEMYNYGEILDSTGGDDNVLFPEYQTYMSITDNGYGNGFANSFAGGSINESVGNFNQRNAKTEKLVYWGESHDTYANDGGESKNKSQNVIDRAYAVVAGNNGATALYFSRPAQKAKNDIKFGDKGSVHFKDAEVAQVNYMHNACAGEPNYYVKGNGVCAQVRKSGAIIVLGSGSDRDVTVANGAGDGKWLKPGTYKDMVDGGVFTVNASTISGHVGGSGMLSSIMLVLLC